MKHGLEITITIGSDYIPIVHFVICIKEVSLTWSGTNEK